MFLSSVYFWLQWRWRRLRDVTLPTPRKEGSFASNERRRLWVECNYFRVADRDEVRCMGHAIPSHPIQSNPIPSSTGILWAKLEPPIRTHGDRSFANCLQTEEEATRFNCYAH